MRKLLCLFALFTIILSSCSSDTNEEETPTPVLVTKIIEEYNSVTSISEFTYDGAKLVTETKSGGFTKHYTYNGDLITYIVTKDNNETITKEVFLEYDSSNKIISKLELDYNASNPNIAGFKNLYTYGTNGVVSGIVYYGSVTEQNNFSYNFKIYYDSNNQIIKYEDLNIDNEVIQRYSFNYDDKNSPYKNIIGYQGFIFGDSRWAHIDNNNTLEVRDMFANDFSDNSYINSYTYNALDYPLTRTLANENFVGMKEYQYFYNQ